MVKPWDFLRDYKGKMFGGEWPTLVETFRISASRFRDRKCFTTYDPEYLSFTYGEALERIETTAAYLSSRGIKKGDKVTVTGKNTPEWAIAYLSVLFAGGIVVPIDYQLRDEEITGLMTFSGVKLLFVDEEKYESFNEKKLNLIEKISIAPNKPNYILNIKCDHEVPTDLPAETDLAAILYTSGTTGIPKGVMLTHRNLVSDCYLAQGNMTLYSSDVFYALLPLHHSYSMLAVFIESFSVGAETVFAKRLAIQQILKDLKQGQVTMFLGIPMLFNKIIKGLFKGIREKGIIVYGIIRALLGISGFIKKVFKVNIGKSLFKGILAKVSLDTNRICICGGGPLPASTFRRFNQMGINFVQGYGLTETSPIVTLNPVEHYKEDSVGKLLEQVSAKILDADENGRGEIALKGPMVMQGYYKNEEETAKVFTADGYLLTGDVGYLDRENYLYLTGRKKNMIVTEGGKNVYPEEIEDYFQLYDEIEQIMVKGYVLDEKMKTEAIEAFVYPTEDFTKSRDKDAVQLRIEEIIDEVNRELLPYQRISRVKVLSEPMEMTTTKKIKRFAVEEGEE